MPESGDSDFGGQFAITPYNEWMMRWFVFLIGLALLLPTVAVAAQATPTVDSATVVCAPVIAGTPVATPISQDSASMDSAELEFDLIFLEAMIPHMEAAVAMAIVARDYSDRPDIDRLAGDIIEAQQLQAESLRDWRADWYPDIPPLTQQQLIGAMIRLLSDSPGVGAPAGLEEMDPQHQRMDLLALCSSGDDIDIAFIDLMVAHNSSSIVLAKQAADRSMHREIREMATSLLTAQQYEIDQLSAWRQAWFPNVPLPDHHDQGV